MACPLTKLIEKFQLQNQKEKNTVTTDKNIFDRMILIDDIFFI